MTPTTINNTIFVRFLLSIFASTKHHDQAYFHAINRLFWEVSRRSVSHTVPYDRPAH